MRTALTLALLACSVVVVGCGRKEEAPSNTAPSVVTAPQSPVKGTELFCSYAPSQSKQVLALSAAAGGAGAGAAAVASAAGLTAVAHSSGAFIFTGVSGYVAGTIGAAAMLPVAVTVGTVVGGAAATIELACVPRNYPELVSRIEAMAEALVASNK